MRQSPHSGEPLKGTGVALITPFRENGEIDFNALEKTIENCIDGGVDFLVSLGTTGEAITLTSDECIQVLNFTKKINAGRLPLVVGYFGGNSTYHLIERIKKFDFDGFDYMMSSGPAYNKPSQEGYYQHFMKIAEVAPVPIIIYNVPGRTASNIDADTIVRLAKSSKKFVAVKEASGDMAQASKILKDKPESFIVLSGDDPLTVPMMSLGAKGIISVIANAFPFEFSEMTKAALNGDYETARYYHELLLDIHPWLYVDGNPAGIKATMSMLGICENELRLPLVPVSDNTFEKLEAEVDKVKISEKLFR